MDLKQLRYDNFFMDIARRCGQMSYATRLQVGAVLTRDNRVLGTGFNGALPGLPNECEHMDGSGALVTKPFIAHAEENLFMFMARSTQSSEGSTLYCTHSTCPICAKLAYGAGVKRLVFAEAYRDMSGVEFLQSNGIAITHLKA